MTMTGVRITAICKNVYLHTHTKKSYQAVCSREVPVVRIQCWFADDIIGDIGNGAITAILRTEVRHLLHILVHNTVGPALPGCVFHGSVVIKNSEKL